MHINPRSTSLTRKTPGKSPQSVSHSRRNGDARAPERNQNGNPGALGCRFGFVQGESPFSNVLVLAPVARGLR